MIRENIRIAFLNAWSSENNLKRLSTRLLAANGILLVIFVLVYYGNHFLFWGSRPVLNQGLQAVKQHVAADPGDPFARLQLASLYFERGEYALVIEQGEFVLATNPESQDALYLVGLAYLQIDNPDVAISLLTRFADLRQVSGMWRTDMYLQDVFYYLGKAYIETGQPDRARQALDLALEIDHTDSDALFLLGQTYAESGQDEKAAEQYLAALAFVPDFEAVYQALVHLGYNPSQPGRVDFAEAGLAYCQRDYSSALGKLHRAVDLQPEFAPAYVLIGLVYEGLGDLNKAHQALGTALELDPDNFLAQHVLGRIAAVRGGMIGSEP